MITKLDNWKKKQADEKPLIYLINTTGGGNRSANFTMNVLQRLDSLSGGTLMDKTFLITGASGGMLGASYYRELARRRSDGIFTSFVARDLASPAQKFKVGDYSYIKDRGYAFEQRLSYNTRGFLNRQLKDYVDDEKNARIRLIFYNPHSHRKI